MASVVAASVFAGGRAGFAGVDFAGVDFASVGFAGVDFAGVGFAGVGFASVGFASVGFAGVGFAVAAGFIAVVFFAAPGLAVGFAAGLTDAAVVLAVTFIDDFAVAFVPPVAAAPNLAVIVGVFVACALLVVIGCLRTPGVGLGDGLTEAVAGTGAGEGRMDREDDEDDDEEVVAVAVCIWPVFAIILGAIILGAAAVARPGVVLAGLIAVLRAFILLNTEVLAELAGFGAKADAKDSLAVEEGEAEGERRGVLLACGVLGIEEGGEAAGVRGAVEEDEEAGRGAAAAPGAAPLGLAFIMRIRFIAATVYVREMGARAK